MAFSSFRRRSFLRLVAHMGNMTGNSLLPLPYPVTLICTEARPIAFITRDWRISAMFIFFTLMQLCRLSTRPLLIMMKSPRLYTLKPMFLMRLTEKDSTNPAPMTMETAMPAGEMPLMILPIRVARASETPFTIPMASACRRFPIIFVAPEKKVIISITPLTAEEKKKENAIMGKVSTL